MLPRQFDADGMVSGRFVREGEVIGKVGNFYRREGATTYHLHFDVQVPTRYGWVFVNPYMTLVAAYERLIRGRGRELQEPDIREEVPTGALPRRLSPAPGSQMPAAMAPKPTETKLESPPAEKSQSGKEGDAVPPVTASMPAAAGGDSGLEHDGVGAER
jgi:hypothetical protein